MAAKSPRERLQEEATCPICLDFFTEPVSLDCGHSFCQACIAKCWGCGASPAAAACPECRESVQPRWHPNRQLSSFAEIARQFSQQQQQQEEAGLGGLCAAHREPLKLFCKDDGVPICVVCDRAKEHRDHVAVPLEEAAQEYKEDFCSRLDLLREERDRILACERDAKQKSQDLLDVTKLEREKTMSEFRKLRQFLEEQEQYLLEQMEEVEKEIARERDEHIAKMTVELSSLENTIQEMEEKIQKPVRDFLKDVRNTLQRCEKKEKFETPPETPLAFPPELKWRIWDFCDLNFFFEGVMKQFKDMLESGVQQQQEFYFTACRLLKSGVFSLADYSFCFRQLHREFTLGKTDDRIHTFLHRSFLFLKRLVTDFTQISHDIDEELPLLPHLGNESATGLNAANVTLDPDTAHPHLALAEDRKSVRRGNRYQDLPDNPERFERHCVVLGCERFSMGRHCWEVTVGREEGWFIGVAKTSVKRKGKFTAGLEGGIWAMRTWKGAYMALCPSSPLSFSGVLRRIRVSLNCAGGRVTFFDANTATPLYTFSEISFSGETLQPFFWVYDKGYLSVS